MVGCSNLLGAGILCSCNCLSRSGHDVSVNFQQDTCYSLFCNFLSLYEWTLKDQSPENGLSCIFHAVGNILLQKVQSQPKHKQQSTKAKVKGTDLIWSQICSSLLHNKLAFVGIGEDIPRNQFPELL